MTTSFSGGGNRREWIQYTGRRVGRNLALGEKLKNNVCFINQMTNVGNSVEFLYHLIPPSVGETNNYNLRNRHNICQTTNRLSISQQSFFFRRRPSYGIY